MKAGDTIYIPNPVTSVDSHLWMVISDPSIDEQCVIVNFTSWRADKDQACVVESHEHPYLAHRSCINFKDAKLVSNSDLDSLIEKRQLQNKAPLSPALLQRIRDSVPDSHMNFNCVEVLVDQGLVVL